MKSPVKPPSVRRPAAGVAESPLGLSGGRIAAATAGIVILAGVLFWLAREPIHRMLGGSADPTSSVAESTDLPPEGPAASVTQGAAEPSVGQASTATEPTRPSWSLAEVGEAVLQAGDAIETLIAEGRSEIGAFKDLESRDSARVERAKRRFAAWGRIWLNRLAVIDGGLPEPQACAIHAAMEPACSGLRAILDKLRSVPTVDGLDDATAIFDTAAAELVALLNPPEIGDELLDSVDDEADEDQPS